MPIRFRTTLAVLVLGLAAGVVLVGGPGWISGPDGRVTTPGRAGTASAPDSVALGVLRDWDARRAAAWAAGDPVRLAGLYPARSTAGAADVALLRRYLARGLEVTDLRMQVLRVRVLTGRPRRVVLEVTDRLASAGVQGASLARSLPSDVATTRRLVLRRVGGAWLMVRVSPVVAQP